MSYTVVEPFAIKFSAAVIAIEQKKKRVYKGGVGKEAVFEEVDLGWFLHLQNSYESLYVGQAHPNLKLGDIVTITLRGPDERSTEPVRPVRDGPTDADAVIAAQREFAAGPHS